MFAIGITKMQDQTSALVAITGGLASLAALLSRDPNHHQEPDFMISSVKVLFIVLIPQTFRSLIDFKSCRNTHKKDELSSLKWDEDGERLMTSLLNPHVEEEYGELSISTASQDNQSKSVH